MRLAFITGAVAAGLAAAALTALGVWIVTVVTASETAWGLVPWLLPASAAVVAVATYAAERTVHRRTMARMASHGEPWAYREG
jgi:hypothetical protein